ncbi:trem-like transcript 4 protein isoform X2 [Panthera pardus]|uniref:Trem-like transcript 4 protein isoform X2 n=1 Tax=Panthera pardus TaxID=9691 RepID=A0A9V1G076_PANPR|nr:trem-like transcript 4 protein isoform X2 [Panthera pardus]
MAGGGTHLLLSVLLMLLASPGSWEQKSLLLRKLEGETVSVKCLYPPWTGSNMMRVLCRDISADTCIVLASNTRLPRVSGEPRNSIQDYSSLGYFIVTMTELRVKDSGFYSCGLYKSSEISVLRKFHLVVSRATTTPSTTSTRSTTAWTSAASSVTDSSESNWHLIIPTSTVAVLLLLVLMVLMILYFKKARGSARKGEDKLHVYDNISVQREKTTEHRKDSSSGQRRSQGSNQQMGSDEDCGAICYASLTHLNNFDLEDSIYVNTHPNLRPTPDPLLTVEYASISGSRPQPSNLTALEGETQELKADFTGQ